MILDEKQNMKESWKTRL